MSTTADKVQIKQGIGDPVDWEYGIKLSAKLFLMIKFLVIYLSLVPKDCSSHWPKLDLLSSRPLMRDEPMTIPEACVLNKTKLLATLGLMQ